MLTFVYVCVQVTASALVVLQNVRFCRNKKMLLLQSEDVQPLHKLSIFPSLLLFKYLLYMLFFVMTNSFLVLI